MEQTQTHSDWYTRFVAEVRAETEHLMDAYQDIAAPTTAQEVERAARALLAMAKVAAAAEAATQSADAPPLVKGENRSPRPLNRRERRRLKAENRSKPQPAIPSNSRPTASAILMPSTAAERIPPA